MKTCCVVPTYRRPELLHGCLRRLRGQDGDVPILVFSDREHTSPELEKTCQEFEARLILQAKHDHLGNSFNSGEALRFAYNSGFELVHYVEDDAFAKPDLLSWTRAQHEEWDDIFCTCGWVFNCHMPFTEDTYFANWIYIPQFSIRREKLALVMPHLNPLYYADMWKYVRENFPENPINRLYPNVVHYEIDGLLQRIIMKEKLQVAWCATAKISHVGIHGYNRGGFTEYEAFFDDCPTFASRMAKIECLALDPYWRASLMDRSHVEREIGHELSSRQFKYRVKVPGGWESDFVSELSRAALPRRINSVTLPEGAQILSVEAETVL
jgi:Glycosyl transferase family 2